MKMKNKKKSNHTFLKIKNELNAKCIMLILFMVVFLGQHSFAQIKDNLENDDSNWRFIISGGLTWIVGKELREESNFNVNLIDYSIGYRFLKKHEIGISIGRKDFAFEQEFLSAISYSGTNVDSQFVSAFGSENLMATSLYYKFNLSEDFNFGLKYGKLSGKRLRSARDLNVNYSTYYEIFSNWVYELNKTVFFNLGMNYSMRSWEFMVFDKNSSPQVSITTGLGFKF